MNQIKVLSYNKSRFRCINHYLRDNVRQCDEKREKLEFDNIYIYLFVSLLNIISELD